VEPFCIVGPDSVSFMVLVPAHFERRKPLPDGTMAHDSVDLWRIDCDRRPSGFECLGMTLDWDDLRAGRLRYLDVALLSNVWLASLSGLVAVIEWGPYVTLTVDVAAGRITYAQSHPDEEGRGEASCPPLTFPAR
jgi:hypothetical protein